MKISIDDQIAEAQREVAMRRHVYARQVTVGRMNQQDADRKIALMEQIVQSLQKVKGKIEQPSLFDA